MSIIIVNYNNINDTIECLDSLKHTIYPNYEIIVVDNGSMADSRQILEKRKDIKLIALDKNYGFVTANNIGINNSSGEMICLLNNDTIVDAKWLSELVNTLLSNDNLSATYPFFIDYGAPKEKTWSTPKILKTLKNGTRNLIGYTIYNVFDDYITTYLDASGCCLLFWKDIFDKYCDEDYFMYYDDVYFCWRLQLQHYKIERTPYAVVYHKGSGTVWREGLNSKGIYFCERNRIMTLLIFYETKTLLKISPLLFLDMIKKIILITTRIFYNPSYAFAIISAWFWLLLNLPNIYKKRKFIQKERKVPDSEIIQGLSYKIANGSNSLGNVLNYLSFIYTSIIGLKTYEFLTNKCK